MNWSFPNRLITKLLLCVFMITQLFVAHAQAAMIPTSELIYNNGQSYSQVQLQNSLTSEELQAQLQAMGVSPEQLNDRIASLTPEEIQQLNAELEKQPAGGDIVGVLLTIFIVLVITDMLCATDVFTFVRCINK